MNIRIFFKRINTFICFKKLKYQFFVQFQVLVYDKKIITPDFNEVSKQSSGQKLKLSMKSSMKSFKKVLFSVINWFKG